MGVLHLAIKSFGKFMKALEVIVVDIFFRLSVFSPFVLGVVFTCLVNLGASPYGSYATDGFVFTVFLLGGCCGNSVAESGSLCA